VIKKDFWEYNPANDTWTQKADFGGTARQVAVGLSIGDKGYIGTGNDGSATKDFWEYDTTSNAWTQKADVGGSVRRHATAFSIDGKGYIGIGWNGGANFQDFWEYDPLTDIWTQKANFGGTARRNAMGFSVDNKGYIGAGFDGARRKDFWEYDPVADTWTQKTDIGGPNRTWTVGFGIGSKGYCGTGTNLPGSYLKDFWEYDPALDTWTQKTDFGGGARAYGFGISIGGKGYIGLGSDGTMKQDVWEFTPDYSSYLTGTNVLCKGDNDGAVDLLVTAGVEPFTFLWSNGATTEDLSGLGGGTYSVIVTDSAGCELNDTITITEPALDLIIDAGLDLAICTGSSVTIGGSPTTTGGVSPYNYTWIPATGLNSDTIANPTANPSLTTSYELVVTDNIGCVKADTVVVIIPSPGDIWTQKADFGGFERGYGVAFSIGTKGYMGTGFDVTTYYKDFWEYNPATDTWTQKADFGGTGRYGAAGFSIGNKGYIGTGTDVSISKKDFWEYDPVGNVWVQKADYGGLARRLSASFSIGGRGYIGTGWTGAFSKDFWEYNPNTDAWTQINDFGGTSRYRPVGFSIGDKGYVGTGFDGADRNDFWEYDATGNSWLQLANFPGTARDLSVGMSIGSKGYIGTGNDGVKKTDFYEFDPKSNTWIQRADFGGTARDGCVAFSVGGRGYFVAGNASVFEQDLWQYSPDYSSYLSDTSVSCKGGNDGSIDLLVIGGTAPYTYLWSNGELTEDIGGLTAGTYTVIITDSTGCVVNDTITITEPALNLIINAGLDDSICIGGSVVIGGAPSASGGNGPYSYLWNPTDSLSDSTIANPIANPVVNTDYLLSVTDSNGCTIVDTIAISINPGFATTDSANICTGDSLFLGGAFQTVPGVYLDTFIAINGCDSVLSTTLLIDTLISTTLNPSICDGDSVFAGGAYQFITGTYVDSFIAVGGCDSVVTSNLTVNLVYNIIDLPQSICSGDSIQLYGIYQNIAGTYYDSLLSSAGCDSIHSVALSVNPTFMTVDQADTICSGDSILIYGNFESIAGVYYDSLVSVNGCDSIHSKNLAVNNSFNNTDPGQSICAGDSILIYGQFVSVAGTYYDSLVSVSGCDSVHSTLLTVNPTFSMTATAIICDNDSIILGGAYQNTAGTYIDTLVSTAGCDSIVSTILFISPTYSLNLDDTICASDSVFLGGAFQNTSGIYTDTLTTVDGCDSVVITNLVVNPVFAVPLSADICAGDSIFLAGAFQFAAGVYDDSLVTIKGCDSIISTTLTVNPTFLNTPSLSICDGDSILIAGAFRSTAGVYTDSALTPNGCDSVTATTLTIDPVYSLNDTAFICDGDSIMLGGAFQSTGGSYLDTFNTVAGCDSIVVTFLIIGTPITLTAASFDALCDGSCDGSAQSTASGGNGPLSYSWSTIPIQTNSTALNLCAGTYIITVMDSAGCQTDDSVTVAQPTPLIPIISGMQQPTCFGVCNGGISASIFGGTPPYTYSWDDPANQTDTSAFNLCADTFAITVVDSNGCTASVSGVVTSPAAISVTVIGTDSLCTDACSGTVTANPAGGTPPYTYAWSNGPTSSSLNSLCIGTYVVTVFDAMGCSLTDSMTIEAYPLENASFSYPGSAYCQNALGPVATITGNLGGSFTAPPSLALDPFTGQIVPDSSQPGTYDVIYTTGGPCPESDTVQIEILPLPNVNITFTPPICGQDTGIITLIANPPGGIWGGPGIVDSINGLFSPILAGPGPSPVIYTVIVSGCSNTDTSIIVVVPIASMSLQGTDTICEGGATIFQVTVIGAGPFIITYTDGTNTFTDSNIFDGGTITFSPSVTTTYSLISLTDSVGCSGSAGGSLTIEVIPAPPAPIVNTPIYHCEGDPFPTLSSAPQSGGILSWYNDTTIAALGSGLTFMPPALIAGSNYFYVSEFINGCTSPASEIEVFQFTQGSINAGADITICLGDDIELFATGGSAYQWYPSLGLSDTTIANPIANPQITTVYYVIGTVNDSCFYEDSIRITVDNSPECGWYIYSGFTPNNDGDNDTWIIDGIEGFPDNEVAIYNRWEDVVQSFKGYDNASIVWNGDNQSGQALPEGTYFYIIVAGDQKYSGWVQISR